MSSVKAIYFDDAGHSWSVINVKVDNTRPSATCPICGSGVTRVVYQYPDKVDNRPTAANIMFMCVATSIVIGMIIVMWMDSKQLLK